MRLWFKAIQAQAKSLWNSIFKKRKKNRLCMVSHVYNPNHMGEEGRRILSDTAPGKKSETLSEI
jgi:hypothetical protein